MSEELKISQEGNELLDLETLITEGVDALIPIEIEFPDGKKAGAKISPISTAQFRAIYSGDNAELLISILELGLKNKNGESISRDLIESLPIGITSKISEQICAISGLELQPEETITAKEIMNRAELFP